MKDSLAEGLKLTAQHEVTRAGAPRHLTQVVLATPTMVGLIEQTCMDCVSAHLDKGEVTVGTHICVSHTAAAYEHEQVTISVELTKRSRRRLTFDIEVTSQRGSISEGSHERAVIEVPQGGETIDEADLLDDTDSRDSIEWGYRQWRDSYGPEVAAAATAYTALSATYRLLATEMDDVVRPFALTPPRVEVLRLLSLSHDKRARLGKLSERLTLHTASITSLMERLETDGLVRRVKDRNDGRLRYAQLTAKGEKLLRRIPVEYETFGSLAKLEPSKLLELIGLLQEIRAAAGEPTADIIPPKITAKGNGA